VRSPDLEQSLAYKVIPVVVVQEPFGRDAAAVAVTVSLVAERL
jgi:hypothetical protein